MTTTPSLDASSSPPAAGDDSPLLFSIELSEAQRLLALREFHGWVQRQMQQRPGPWGRLLLWVGLGGLMGALVRLGLPRGDGAGTLALILLVMVGLIVALVRAAADQHGRIARQTLGAFQLTLDGQGLTQRSPGCVTRDDWSQVLGWTANDQRLLVLLPQWRYLCLPLATMSEGEKTALLARFRQQAGSQERASLQQTSPGAGPEGRLELAGRGRWMSRKLIAGLLAGLGAPHRLVKEDNTADDLVAFTLGLMGLDVLLSMLMSSGHGYLNPVGIPWALYGLVLILLAAWSSARLAGQATLALNLAGGLVLLSLPAQLLSYALAFLPEGLWQRLGPYGEILVWLPQFAFTLAGLRYLQAALGGSAALRGLYALSSTCFLLLPPLLIGNDHFVSLWTPVYGAQGATGPTGATGGHGVDEADGTDESGPVLLSEAALYAQPALLSQALGAVRPGTKGKPELFLLALGGDGEEPVFLKEVDQVGQIFQSRFATSGHQISLINNLDTAETRPMATLTALRQSLKTLGQRMNPEEDVLFLFVTSHGSPEHELSLRYPYLDLDQLDPVTLRQLLDEAGIRNRVIAVSACYSGGFIPALADDHTLVMSASRADRNSHGCAPDLDWTFFGRAYFDEALRYTDSFEAAFADAKKRIAAREAAEKLTPSEPQIAVGKDIRPVLARLEAAWAAQQAARRAGARP